MTDNARPLRPAALIPGQEGFRPYAITPRNGAKEPREPGVVTEYTKTALAAKAAEVVLWETLIAAGCPAPFPTGGPNEWILQDRNRAFVRGCVAQFNTLEVRTAAREYDKAATHCIKTNMGLVHQLAGRLERKGKRYQLEKEDLVQEGTMGLQRALDTFDPAKKVSFATYAYFWVYQTINRAIGNAGIIRVPIRTRELGVEDRGKRSADLVSKAKAAEMVGRLDAAAHKDAATGKEITVGDTTADDKPLADDLIAVTENGHAVAEALEKLSFKERAIIVGRFWEDKTLKEIGDELGVSRERIRQIERDAVETLRSLIKASAINLDG